MERDVLWAPWRIGYLVGSDRGDPAAGVRPERWRPAAAEDCFLCLAAAAAPAHDRALGVLERTAHSCVVLNRYPYANGHLLVAPLDHRADLAALPAAALLDLQQCLVRWSGVIGRTMQAQGFNVGLNVGAVAGAGLPGHLHWHLVPRWPGDLNFMATVAGIRVLPQALDALWDQLAGAAGGRP
jgi:ATP adenylyltransferase